jgi:polar amino acid transport system permease protein
MGADMTPGASHIARADLPVVPLRRPGLWISSAIGILLLLWLAVAVWNNPHINHAVIWQYQFAPVILDGLMMTLAIALLAGVLGLVLGTLLALMRLSDSLVLRLGSGFYTWVVRGTPLLVQIIIWGNLALLFEYIGPFKTNALLTPFIASVIALGLNEAAYLAEIIRAGILSVDRGQHEASMALGMRRRLTLRRIVLPQALRVILPPAGNQFVSLLLTPVVSQRSHIRAS